MKSITPRLLLLAVFTLGLSTELPADEAREYPQVSLIGPGGSKNPARREDFLILVIEGPFLSYETKPIPSTGAVDYINNLLKVKNVAYIGVYTREGIKYGDVVRAIDVLRQTKAKNIGVSMAEIAVGREP